MSVAYSDKNQSRISSKIVARWRIEDKIYPLPISGLKSVHAIDLTWDLQNKTHTTVFEVVSDEDIEADAEFGQNRFVEPQPKQTREPPVVSKYKFFALTRIGHKLSFAYQKLQLYLRITQ